MSAGNGAAPAGPGANGGRSKMSEQLPGLPAGMTREVAEQLSAELNWWQETRNHVQPGYLQFFTKVVQLASRTPDGDSAIVPAVQLTASTVLGPIVLHLPPDMAVELSAQLAEKAREADTGITTARRSSLLLPGQG